MLNLLVFFVLMFVAGFGLWFLTKRLDEIKLLRSELLATNDEMRQTMAYGLYHFYKSREKQDDSELARFVARVLSAYYGGLTRAKHARELGVHIEDMREDGRYLGHVICAAEPVDFEPVAIIHSQIVKQNAKSGFVVTTSTFTANAISYANTLGIELIDGKTLVEYWVQAVDSKRYRPEPEMSG